MDAIPYLDELVKEYLLFRGYTNTFHVFNQERGADPTRLPQVQSLTEHAFHCIDKLDLKGLQDLWSCLETRMLSHVAATPAMSAAARRLYGDLLRCYLVTCVLKGQSGLIMQFLEKHGPLLASKLPGEQPSEWDAWFALPFTPDPATAPRFAAYFAPEWRQLLETSLRNFLSTSLQNLALPKLLAFNVDRAQRKALKSEVQALQSEIKVLKQQLHAAELEALGFKQSESYRQMGFSGLGHGIELMVDQSRSAGAGAVPGSPAVAAPDAISSSTATSGGTAAAVNGTGQQQHPAVISAGSSSSNGLLVGGASDAGIRSASTVTGAVSAPQDQGHSLTSSVAAHQVNAATPALSPRVIESAGDPTSHAAATNTATTAPAGLISTRRGSSNESAGLVLAIESQVVFTGHTGPISRVRFSPDGARIASASRDGTVRVWRTDGSEAPETTERPPSPPSFFSRILRPNAAATPAAAASAINGSIPPPATSSSDVRTVVTRCTQPLSSCLSSGEVLSLAWHPHQDGLLLLGTADSRIRLWSTVQRKFHLDFDVATGSTHSGSGGSAVSSSKSDRDRDGRDKDREQKAQAQAQAQARMDAASLGFAECPRVLDATFSPNQHDSLLITAAASRYHDTLEGGKGVLSSWALQPAGVKRLRVFPIEASRTQVNSVVFNHNGNMLVTAGADGFVRVFDMGSSSPIMGWPAHDGQVSCVRFSSDETSVVSVGVDGWIMEWSLHRIGKRMRCFKVPDTDPSVKTRFPVTRHELAVDPHGPHWLSSSPLTARSAYLYHTGPAEGAAAGANSSASNAGASTLSSVAAGAVMPSVPSAVLQPQPLPGHSSAVLSVDWHGSAAACVTGSLDHLVCATRFVKTS